MLRIVHISDLHFGPPYVPEVGAALLRAIPPLEPDLIVVSGDFTQRATREQFQAAAAWMERLPAVPRVVVPGNHDVPLYRVHERLLRPLDLYRQHISPELNGVMRLASGPATVVWLDSTSPRRTISNGRLHLWQLRMCEDAFAGTPAETLRIVVAHHHFLTAPDFARDRRMQRGGRALDVLVRQRVDLILGGHLHRAYLGNSLDTYAGHDREHGVIVVQCGTSTSRRGRGREREKNSFNLIEAGDETITVTHHLHFHDHGRFEPTSRHEFPRPSRRSFDAVVRAGDHGR